MKFTASREALAAAVASAAQGVPGRPVQEIYAGMLIDVPDEDQLIDLTGSDGDVTFTASFAAGRIDGTGSCVLPGKLLAEIMRYLPGESVTICSDGTSASVASGRSKFTMPSLKGENYPQLADISRQPKHGTASGPELADALRKVIPAAAKYNPPVLTAIALSIGQGGLTLVGSDGTRLARAECPFSPWGPPPEDTLLPARAAERFARLVGPDAVIGWDDKLISLETQQQPAEHGLSVLRVITRRIAGEYLPWRKLTAPSQWCEADPGELARAVRMAMLPLDDDRQPVTLTLRNESIEISSSGQRGRCAEEVLCSYQGLTQSLVLSPQMLLDGLAGCSGPAELAVSLRKALFLSSAGFTYSLQSRREGDDA